MLKMIQLLLSLRTRVYIVPTLEQVEHMHVTALIDELFIQNEKASSNESTIPEGASVFIQLFVDLFTRLVLRLRQHQASHL